MTGASSRSRAWRTLPGNARQARRARLAILDVRGLHHSWEIEQPEILIRTARPARLLWPRLPSSPTTHQSSWESCGAYLPTSSVPYSSMKSGCSRSTDRRKCTSVVIVVCAFLGRLLTGSIRGFRRSSSRLPNNVRSFGAGHLATAFVLQLRAASHEVDDTVASVFSFTRNPCDLPPTHESCCV